MIGIYKITNPKGKIYIGQSINIEKRFNQYQKFSEKGTQTKLFNSFKKYEINNHTFEIVEECIMDILNIKERYYQEFYNSIEEGLNCIYTKTNIKPSLFSEETRVKMSESRKGLKLTLETKNKISNSHTGKKITGERLIKLREFNKSKSKPIIDTVTHKIWYSLRECALENNISKSALNNYLLKKNPNKTNLIYLNEING